MTKRHTPAKREPAGRRGVLARILDTPHLARIVPLLPPEVLHRVIQNFGLEACGDLMALATPAQLTRVFDLDLWSPARPGLDEQFDADRFGLWLEVMAESGAESAARTLTGVDVDLAVAGFAQYVLVSDPATLAPPETADGDEMPDVATAHGGPTAEVGGYLVVGKRADAWDAVVAILQALAAQHQTYFGRVMRGCRQLSNAGDEADGLDDLLDRDEQSMFDVAVARERRREQQGYMTPAQARAFLQMSRAMRRAPGATPPANPIAKAYFHGMEWIVEQPDAAAAADNPAASVDAVVDLLRDAGVLPQPPRALLGGPQGPPPRLARIQALLQCAGDRDYHAFSTRSQELAFLANAIAAGCSIQARPFTPEEASDAAVATCNLGLEHWPAGAALPDDFLVAHDLVSVFQVGWTVLYEDVCLAAAKQLIGVLKALRCADRETRAGVTALRLAMTRAWKAGTPWQAREALDVLTSLDLPAWAGLLGLIAECPVMHAGIAVAPGSHALQISATDFAFISENSQIASIGAFMRSLPETLSG